jgi:hypothetical protein
METESFLLHNRIRNLYIPNLSGNISTTTNTMQTAATSSQSVVEDLVALLSRNLEQEWVRRHLPKGIEKGFSEARTNATERILLQHGGTAAWVAYFRAMKEQKSQNASIAAFQGLSDGDRMLVAQRVAAGRKHDSIIKIGKIISTPRKRRSK